MTVAFPANALGSRGDLEARWGFAGWGRAAGTVVPGHEAARPRGFGALPDGRAFVALASEAVLVDPETGRIERLPWPEGCPHAVGRELCVVTLGPDEVLVRGASGPSGGWARRLRLPEGRWLPVAPGPETGTVAAHPDGGYAWLTGRSLHRRLADGTEPPPMTVDAPGRLLGFDPTGAAVVRLSTGNAVRLDPGSGAVVARIEGRVLALDAGGAVLLLEDLDARHRELATGVRLGRVLPDGAVRGPYPLALKTFPADEPPLRVAALPGDGLLVLGGTTWWRRLPDHDWWGATVERWNAVWAGSRPETRVSSGGDTFPGRSAH
jgi:hypothetical protein